MPPTATTTKPQEQKNIDTFNIDAKNLTLTREGFLEVDALVTRVGVFIYRDAAGGVVRQLRPKDEVLEPKSYNTLKGKSITDDHPKDFVISKNYKKHNVGHARDIVEIVGDEYIKLKLLFCDADAIEQIKTNDKVQISCGYTCTYDHQEGEYNGEPYDLIQRDIVYNHIALVYKGRAGNNVKLLMDCAENVAYMVQDNDIIEPDATTDNKRKDQDQDQNSIKPRSDMEKITIDGVEYEVSPEVKKALDNSTTNSKLKAAEDALSSAKKELDETKAKLDSLEDVNKELKEKSDQLENEVANQKKADIVQDAVDKGLIKDGDIEIADMEEISIKKKILELNDVRMSADSDAYIEGRYSDFVADKEDEKEEEEEANDTFDGDVVAKKTGEVESNDTYVQNESRDEFLMRKRKRLQQRGGN